MNDSEADPYSGEEDLLQAVANGSQQLRRRLSSFAGIPAAAAARTPDPLPGMDTALDRLQAARRSAGMPDLDDAEGLAFGVGLAREAREDLAALDH